MKHVTKWRSISEYVDLETGEIITKNVFEKSYYKVRSSKKTIIEEVIINQEKLNYGTIKHTTECRRRNQRSLFE